ncbi:MAG: hypothetical protein WB510_11075 [Candidatus Sulfotelmatobacter sp.]
MILESVVFFALLLATTVVVAVLPRTINAHAWLAIPCCALALAAAGAVFLPLERDEPGLTTLGIVAIVFVLVMRIAQRRWSFVGAQLFVAVTAAASATPSPTASPTAAPTPTPTAPPPTPTPVSPTPTPSP